MSFMVKLLQVKAGLSNSKSIEHAPPKVAHHGKPVIKRHALKEKNNLED